MSWENQQPPWGQKRGPQTPEELIAALLAKIRQMFEGGGRHRGDGGKPSAPKAGGGLLLIAIVLLVLAAYGSFYTIKPGERGVVLRFGKFSSLSSPGLNFKMPLVDRVIKVDVETVRKEEFGFRTRAPGQRTQYAKQGYDNESLMLTGDRNVIDVEWIVQYKAEDPVAFLFNVRDVRQAVRDVSEMTIRRIVGNMDFDSVLSNREILAAQTAREIQATLNSYQSGVRIVTVQLQDVNPPEPVKPAFNEVNEADQDMKRLVNEAEEAYNREVPKARGAAKKLLEEAHGYAVERVNLAKGETARYLDLLEEYRRAKEVTRQRLYLEAMQQVLPQVTEVYVIDKDQKSLLPLLDLKGTASKKGGQP